MGVRGPQPGTNSRRNGARIAISPEHVAICDHMRLHDMSRADVVEAALEFYQKYLATISSMAAK
jgi:hypothetical protein